MSDNGDLPDPSATSDPISNPNTPTVDIPKKRGRPRGSTSKVTPQPSPHIPDDITNEIQKLILKKRIKKYVSKYIAKYQKPPLTYNEPLYGDTSQPQDDESEEEDDPIEEEEEDRSPPLQTKRANKYRRALLH